MIVFNLLLHCYWGLSTGVGEWVLDLKLGAYRLLSSVWKLLLRLNYIIGLCIIFDFFNRTLKLLYSLYVRNLAIVEILPPVYERGGTFLNSVCFLIQAVSFIMLYRLLKILAFLSVTEDITFHLLWNSRSSTWGEFLWAASKVLAAYLKTVVLWFIAGIPPRLFLIIQAWTLKIGGLGIKYAPPVHVPYLESLHRSIQEFRIFFVNKTVQLNPKLKFGTPRRCKTDINEGRIAYLLQKFGADLTGIEHGNSPTIEDNFEKPHYSEEAKVVSQAIAAVRPQRELFVTYSDWFRHDPAYRADVSFIVNNIKSKLTVEDYVKLEAETVQRYSNQLDSKLSMFRNHGLKLPDEVKFGFVKTLNSKFKHPTFRQFLKAQHGGGELPFDMGYTSNMVGIWKAYDKGDAALLTHIPLGQVEALNLPHAKAPGAYAYAHVNPFKPEQPVERGPWDLHLKLEAEVRRSDIVSEITDSLILYKNRVLAYDILHQRNTGLRLTFNNPELIEFHSALEDAISDVDVSEMQEMTDLPTDLLKAQLHMARIAEGRGMLVDSGKTAFLDNKVRIAEYL